jgi:hypothetical protein
MSLIPWRPETLSTTREGQIVDGDPEAVIGGHLPVHLATVAAGNIGEHIDLGLLLLGRKSDHLGRIERLQRRHTQGLLALSIRLTAPS